MYPYLKISVGDRETQIDYVVDGQALVTHVHPVGFTNIELDGMNRVAASKFIDGVIYALHFVSLHDRIPTDFRLHAPRYATWIGETLEGNHYAQFYTGGAPVRVTLHSTQDPSRSYARHTQTILSFKV